MKKIMTLLTLAMFALIGSCKKENSEQPIVEEIPETPPTANLKGTLAMITLNDIGSTPIISSSFACAFFYEKPDTCGHIVVDCVLVNGFGLTATYTNSIDYLSPVNAIPDLTKANWEVLGNNGIPSFKYENKRSMPVYTGYGAIPDVLSSKKDYTLTLTGLSNTDFYVVSIRDLKGNNVRKTQFDITNKSITFTAAELGSLDTSTITQMLVVIVNQTTQTYGGKSFLIQNEVDYYKKITIN